MAEQAAALAAHQQAIGRLVPFLEAMRSIAEIAWRRAAQRLGPLAAYHDAITSALAAATAALEVPERLALGGRTSPGPPALLLVTAERGLCGPFPSRLVSFGLRRAQELAPTESEVRLLCLGSRGRALLAAAGRPLLYARPLPSLTVPTYVQVEAIALDLLDLFEQGAFGRLEVVYHAPTRRFQYAPAVLSLLPTPLTAPTQQRTASRVTPTGDERALVTQLMTEVALSGLYHAVVSSAVSEQLARVYAMRLAAERAQALLDDLTLAYNTAMQQEVTSALLEVVAGYQTAVGG